VRIAFVSREYAGIGTGGGIGTYVRNAAQMLVARGHHVAVFTAGPQDHFAQQAGLRVHAVIADRADFAQAIAARFLAAHRDQAFDVIESAEFGADAAIVFKEAPEVARVVKLHTAEFQLGVMNEAYVTIGMKARFVAGALRRGRKPKPFWDRYDAAQDPERAMTLLADEITSPSQAMLDWTSDVWPIGAIPSAIIPNVFSASSNLLASDPAGRGSLVTFVGKLEARKGVLDLALAIPKILQTIPAARFRFVGSALPHPATGQPLDAVIRQLAGPTAAARIEFTGAVAYDEVAGHLIESAIAVFPSYWENHPYTCLEAMVAGCAVVGSQAGGMMEMMVDGESGLLVPPKDPAAIARAVTRLLADAEARQMMATRGRARALDAYSPDAIGPLQEASYQRAIGKSRLRSR